MTIDEFLPSPEQLAEVEFEVLRLAHREARALVKQGGYRLTQDQFIIIARCYAYGGFRRQLLPEAIANLRL